MFIDVYVYWCLKKGLMLTENDFLKNLINYILHGLLLIVETTKIKHIVFQISTSKDTEKISQSLNEK